MKRGFTILEIMVSAALLLLATGLIFQFLVPALQASSRSQVRVEMQQTATVALEYMVRDLERTSPGGVTLESGILAVNPVEQLQNDGTLIWEDVFVVYYWDTTNQRLIRREWPPGPPAPRPEHLFRGRAKRLDSAILSQISVPAPDDRVMATGVIDFAVEDTGTGVLAQPLTVRLRLQRGANTGRSEQETFEMKRVVYLEKQR